MQNNVHMGQLIRIREMEQRLDEATTAIRLLDNALNCYEAVQESVGLLSTYLSSDEWRQDLSDDEKGFLPRDLKRGVLSEDGIWNLLDQNRELALKMRALSDSLLESDQPE